MGKTIKINKPILITLIIILLLIGYYIYYQNSNIYKEFETSSNKEELLPYENEQEKNEEQEEITNQEEKIEDVEIILVHITGQVKNAGVVELQKGARVIDAVNKAGGFTEQADTEEVNLAYEVSDGIQIYIPGKNEIIDNNERKYINTNSGDNVVMEEKRMKQSNNTLININEATQTELETLPGIGPSIALKIISYREQEGKFLTIEDIKNVSGIGENKFENIRELICV
jgi:competence protein ComEA